MNKKLDYMIKFQGFKTISFVVLFLDIKFAKFDIQNFCSSIFIKNSYLDIIDKPKAGDILVARFPPSRLLPFSIWSGRLILF